MSTSLNQINNFNQPNNQNQMNMMNNVNPINPINANAFNNQMAMNQMNQYMMAQSGNNLYCQTFQNTWQNMQQNVNLIETNFNNMSNILSLINLPIVVPYHNQHPLINCKTPGRKEISQYWICNNCRNSYSYNVPTFYCTACDFDLCQKCLLSLSAFMIAIYNYNQSYIYASKEFANNKCYKPNVHNHPIVRIIREPTYSSIELKCNACFKNLQKEEAFYYCSLCNYCLCIGCYNNLNNIQNQNQKHDIIDPYLHGDQMNPNS